jgi:hypothetical protein
MKLLLPNIRKIGSGFFKFVAAALVIALGLIV